MDRCQHPGLQVCNCWGVFLIFRTNEMVLLPSYMGQRTSCIRIKKYRQKRRSHGCWQCCARYGMIRWPSFKLKGSCARLVRSGHKRVGTSHPRNSEKMPDSRFVDEGGALKVLVEGSKLRCFMCGLKEYVFATCELKTAVKEAENAKTPSSSSLRTPQKQKDPPLGRHQT